MARSLNMQTLTGQIKVRWPGVVVYGIGDLAHQSSPSGHNEDDTPGSRPEQEDPDNKPEHRALDVMEGPRFSEADAWLLVTALVTIPANQRRLLYVIYDGWIWRARNGWKKERFSGDPHRDHPHISGTWQDDDNTAPWILDTPQEEEMSQRLEWLAHCLEFGLEKYPTGPEVPAELRGREVQVVRKLNTLLARPAGTLALTPEDKADLIAGFGAAAEAAVRKVLGQVDGAVPPA